MKYDTFIFDMDGTLSDTSPGVFAGLRIAFDALGMPVPEEAVLRRFIGPPLLSSFKRELGMDDCEAERAAAVFRSYYKEKGLFQCELYPGMRELLHKLKGAGARLTVATLKVESSAVRIVEHLGLSDVFDAVVGADLAGERTKKDTILMSLARADIASRASALLIGDSEYDAAGALEAGIDFCAALYGFGFDDPSVLKRCTYALSINSPPELWEAVDIR